MHKSPDSRPCRLLAMMSLIAGCATATTSPTPIENALERVRLGEQCRIVRSEIATRRATVRAYLGLGMGFDGSNTGAADCGGVREELDVIADLLAMDETKKCAATGHTPDYATVKEVLL